MSSICKRSTLVNLYGIRDYFIKSKHHIAPIFQASYESFSIGEALFN